jgi:hypothetical protein
VTYQKNISRRALLLPTGGFAGISALSFVIRFHEVSVERASLCNPPIAG